MIDVFLFTGYSILCTKRLCQLIQLGMYVLLKLRWVYVTSEAPNVHRDA